MRPEQGTLISRAQAMAALLELLTDQPLIVCNGFPSREVQKIADRPTHFYMIGSMGNAPAIALGNPAGSQTMPSIWRAVPRARRGLR